MGDRVVVFIDYMNTYRGARRAFHQEHGVAAYGQTDPLKLAGLIASDSPYDRDLVEVRVYRGLPDSTKQPQAYGATVSQIAHWEKLPMVKVFARPLNYRGWPDESPREKGVDVALAVDFVVMAVKGEYDIGVIMSADTDLRPAIEAVAALGPGSARAEVAAWKSAGYKQRLSFAQSQHPYCHYLEQAQYNRCRDLTQYGKSARKGPVTTAT